MPPRWSGYWDHDLGPDELRLLVTATGDGAEAEQPRDLTREPGRALDEHSFELPRMAATR